LIRDEGGEINVGVITAVALVLIVIIAGLILLVKVTPYLQEKEKTIIDIPEDSPWANGASDFLSDIGWALLIAGILGGILIWLIWNYTQR
jgi:type II secretory pathway component PulF